MLGPVLLLIFINDLDMETTEKQIIKKFADNTKIAQFIESPEDSVALQVTLNKLGAWAERWGMQSAMSCILEKNNPRNVYMMNGVQLTATTEERDNRMTVSWPAV